MFYVILVKSFDSTKWNKKWPADPKIIDRSDTKEIDKIIEQTLKAGDMNEVVRRRSLRFTDKKKVKLKGPYESQESGEPEGGENTESGGEGA